MTPKREYLGDYIQGRFVFPKDSVGEVPSINPGDLSVAPLPFRFAYEHVLEAVRAAKRSFDHWKRLAPSDRFTALAKYRELLRERAEVIGYWISFEVGKPIWESREELNSTLSLIDYYLNQGSQTSVAIQIPDVGNGATGTIRFLPRGVMAIMSPAYSPLQSPHSHFIPALIHGNTVVFKSSKHAPMVGQLIAECIHDSGLPAGVFNLIHGNSESARRLTIDPDVDGIFFTGAYETGSKIHKQVAGDYSKHVVLEHGGKNGAIIWEDCDLPTAVQHSLLGAYLTSGQRCTTTSRLLVHEKIYERFVAYFHQLSKRCSIDYGIAEGGLSPFMGPLLTEAATEDYLRYQGIAIREGCEELMRGKILDRPRKGYYVSPSIHLVPTADPKSVYQKSEIHGPNVAIYKVNDLDEAVDILNQSQTGLVASLYGKNKSHFVRMAESARVGILHWNRPTTHISYKLPLGGIEKSGNGRAMGSFAGYQCTYPLSCVQTEEENIPLPSEMPKLEQM